MQLPEPERVFKEENVADKIHKTEIALSFASRQLEETKKFLAEAEKLKSQIAIMQRQAGSYKRLAVFYKNKLDENTAAKLKGEIDRLEKRAVFFENEAKTHKKNYEFYQSSAKRLAEYAKKLEGENNELKALVKEMDRKNLELEKIHSEKINRMKETNQNELNTVIRQYMDKEVTLNAKVESLKSELIRYFEIIKGTKTKEREFTEKLNNLIKDSF